MEKKKIANQALNKSWRRKTISEILGDKVLFINNEYLYLKGYSLRGVFHNTGKLFLCFAPWMSYDKAKKTFAHLPQEITTRHKSINDLFYLFLNWSCFAQKEKPALANAYQVLLHYYPQYLKIMLPVCLAIDPSIVMTETLPFTQGKQLAEHEQKAIYGQIIQILSEIAEQLPNSEEEVNKIKKHTGSCIYAMSPAEIFILMLRKLSYARLQDIRFSKMKDSLRLKIAAFSQAQKFIEVEKIIQTQTDNKSCNLFLK